MLEPCPQGGTIEKVLNLQEVEPSGRSLNHKGHDLAR